jgi:hypothetical protein
VRVTDGMKPTSMTPVESSNVGSGVKPPGMTPVPGQQIPANPPIPPAHSVPLPKK